MQDEPPALQQIPEKVRLPINSQHYVELADFGTIRSRSAIEMEAYDS